MSKCIQGAYASSFIHIPLATKMIFCISHMAIIEIKSNIHEASLCFEGTLANDQRTIVSISAILHLNSIDGPHLICLILSNTALTYLPQLHRIVQFLYRKVPKGQSIKYVRFRGWVRGTTKNVLLSTGIG